MTARTRYPIRAWRAIGGLVASYASIALAIALTLKVSWWWWPIACIVIANRQATLLLLTHEGLHGIFLKNRTANDTVTRYLCGFPVFISLSRYRRLHLLHHRAVPHPVLDPDFELYNGFPMPFPRYVLRTVRRILTLRTFFHFATYFTDVPDALSGRGRPLERLQAISKRGDFIAFVLFQLALAAVLTVFHLWTMYLVFFLLPLILLMQPVVLFGAALQHGPVTHYARHAGEYTRTVEGPEWFMTLMLPCDSNFHAEHHLNPAVPHYWLRRFGRDLRADPAGPRLWRESYFQALLEIFDRRPPSNA